MVNPQNVRQQYRILLSPSKDLEWYSVLKKMMFDDDNL